MKPICGAVLGVLMLADVAAAAGRTGVEVRGNVLLARAAEDVAGAQVTVTGPGNFVLQRAFAPGEAVSLALSGRDGEALADGQYDYEVVWSPRAAATRGAAELAGGEAVVQGPRASGTFRVSGGQAVQPAVASERRAGAPRRGARDAGGDQPVPPEPDDQVIADDLIVQGSTCSGLDCVNNESFGFDTIRLKENNTRLQFFDTSTGAFPSNNWQIRANDSASGGRNFLGFVDQGADGSSETGSVLLSVTAGAPADSIRVDGTGRVGFRTATPVLDLHVKTGNTPAMRLEQDGSSGFTAQTWDIAGNEANFFVRDVTGGSRLPFRIRPGAPTSSIDVSASGNVGVGTASPSAALHVSRSDGTAKLLVQENNATADRVTLQLQNSAPNNKTRFLVQSGTGASGIWSFDNNGQALDSFSITRVGAAANAFTLTSAGNLTIAGTLTQGSDRASKDDINAVDPLAVLAKVSELPIATWRYKGDGATHVGPMAQDFHAAFGLGADDKHIAPGDMAAVALAAVQALNAEVARKDARIQALEAELGQLKSLEERLAQLEAARQP